MTELSVRRVHRLIRKTVDCKVSAEVPSLMAGILEEYGKKTLQKAKILATHANRKTITAADLALAIRGL